MLLIVLHYLHVRMVLIESWSLASEIYYEVITLGGIALQKPQPELSRNCTGPSFCEYKLPGAMDAVLRYF